MRCQSAFSQIMEKIEGQMIDPSEMEIAAIQACLGPLGDYVAAIGIDLPLASYRKEDVLQLIDVVITAYQECMTVEHERVAERDRSFLDARLARVPHSARVPGVPF
jgi:hypothetical protein